MTGCDKLKSFFTRKNSSRTTTHKQAEHAPAAHKAAEATPKLAIILDDLGADPAAVDSVLALHYPLTVSVLPFHPRSQEISREARKLGFQVMLHLPMQSVGDEARESVELRPGMSAQEVATELGNMLGSVPDAAGINNHQGSLATANEQLMSELMPILRERHLFFIDSRTTAATVAYDTAEKDGVRTAFRNVPFLDDVQDEAAIRHQMELAIRGAEEKGAAIAIGHPHPATLKVLREMLPEMNERGVQLVHASELVH